MRYFAHGHVFEEYFENNWRELNKISSGEQLFYFLLVVLSAIAFVSIFLEVSSCAHQLFIISFGFVYIRSFWRDIVMVMWMFTATNFRHNATIWFLCNYTRWTFETFHYCASPIHAIAARITFCKSMTFMK